MSVVPVNIARVSQNLKSFNLLNTVRGSQLSLFRTQNQLATGLRFNAPSEDPLRASDALKLDDRMDLIGSVANSLRRVNATLTEGESAMQAAVDLVRDGHTLAIQTVGDELSPDEKQALRPVIESAIQQLVSIGNRKHLDTYLFSGYHGSEPPFEWVSDGVIFRGDDGRLETIVDTDLSSDTFTIAGKEFFRAASSKVVGFVDLNPAVTMDTRLSDLRGANQLGIRPGRIEVSDGTNTVEIDLSGCATVGDVVDKLNAEMPGSLQATISPTSILIGSPGGVDFTITDVGGGQTAADLGIRTTTPVDQLIGADLDPKLTNLSKLDDLLGGAGVDLSGGLVIRNGARVASLGFTDAATIEDVVNTINGAPVGAWARVSDDGRRIEVLNRISGPALTIEEAGGQAATALGIRSTWTGSKLSDLNDGRGVSTVNGADFRITTASGATVDVDLDALSLSSATLQEVIDLINTLAAGDVTASLASAGNGIAITDNTVGAGTLTIEKLNLSPAIDGLGLSGATLSGNVLTGRDVNPVIVDSPFTALLELRDGIDRDDNQAVSWAGERLARVLKDMQSTQGELAAKARSLIDRAVRVDDEATATRIMLSDVRDVDMAEAVVRFQQVQTALQANLATSSKVLGMSLIDYLR